MHGGYITPCNGKEMETEMDTSVMSALYGNGMVVFPPQIDPKYYNLYSRAPTKSTLKFGNPHIVSNNLGSLLAGPLQGAVLGSPIYQQSRESALVEEFLVSLPLKAAAFFYFQ